MQFFRSVRVSPGVAIIIAFVAGIVTGSVFPHVEPAIGPVGTIWIKAISALVVPLVVALLITSIASLADARSVGRIGIRAIAIFLALLIVGAIVIALVTPSLLTLLRVSRTGAVSLNGALLTAPAATAPLGFWQWVAALIPSNPIAAAADGALLPLVIFTVAFGVALTRLKSESCDHVVGFFRGVRDVMLELVRWVLWIAPLGIFGLACTLGARAGANSAHIVVSLVILVAAVCIVYICALYLIAVVAGGMSFTRFARAIAPAQIVGFSSRSSLASLPPMIEAADRQLDLPPAITGFLLP
ncbi:MAG TPA: cation:dicarboxylase symporter family transporter, partial [Gemmatimonadaceae bacterium]